MVLQVYMVIGKETGWMNSKQQQPAVKVSVACGNAFSTIHTCTFPEQKLLYTLTFPAV